MLSAFLGKTIDINFGGTATARGKLLDIIDEVVKMQAQDETIFYVSIGKIHMFCEVKEKDKAVGFIPMSGNKD
jgi:hypothetical protein